MTILGLGFKARSGKDTVASYLEKEYGFRRVAFAAPLKAAAAEIFGLNASQLYGDLKEVEDPFWGLTPRNILQRMGTEAMRGTFGDDIWVMALKRHIEELSHRGYSRFVVTDMRFPNEVAGVKAMGGYSVRVDRASAKASGGVANHESETALEQHLYWDFAIDNNGSLTDLYTQVDTVMGKLRG